MNYHDIIPSPDEKPLDRLVDSYSHTSIFRTMAFIGDSLSSGEFETHVPGKKDGNYDFFEYSWGQFIARKNGIKAYNFSCGGMTAKGFVNGFADWHLMWNRDKACQAYVIALGVNDVLNGGAEIGTADDVDVNDYCNNKPTFMGYYATIVSKYKEISHDAKFFFATLPDEGRSDSDKVEKINKALYELADIFDNCYVIDLYKYGPKYDEEFKRQYYLYTHLSPAGYLFTAKMIDSYIDYIIRHNPDDFKNVAFIGTGIEYKAN